MTSATDRVPTASVGEITVRYWAAARAAAGVEADRLVVDGPLNLAQVLSRVRALHEGTRFGSVLGTCSLLVGDRPVAAHDPEQVVVRPGDAVEVLPAFAGG